MRLTPNTQNAALPFGLGSASVDLSEEGARVAFALYVELSTRVATEPPVVVGGSVREVLSSLHSLFGVTLQVLRDSGPDAVRARTGAESIGSVALRVLNEGLRPPLARWHASLSEHERACWRRWLDEGKSIPSMPAAAAALVDERAWGGYDAFTEELTELLSELRAYVELLRKLAGLDA